MQTDAHLSEAEKVKVRHHLSFLNVTDAYTLAFGAPTAIQPQFWVEGAMLRVRVEALGLVRDLIGRCDAVEAQMFENTENQAVESIGNITINKDEFEQLETGPLRYWQDKLANALGIIKNPYAPNSTAGGINVPVR